RPRFIRTVHGYGYSFVGEARDDGDPAAGASRPVLQMLLLGACGSPRRFDHPFSGVLAALEERGGAAAHVGEFAPSSRPPAFLRELASLAQPTQVVLPPAALDARAD